MLFVPCVTVAKISGGISAVVSALLIQLWSATGWNLLKLGMHIASRGGHAILRARFFCIVSDEKAIKDVFEVKGASGIRPCL